MLKKEHFVHFDVVTDQLLVIHVLPHGFNALEIELLKCIGCAVYNNH